ncbi:MAG: hypothetical protein FJ245_13875 [Nitrospira sp.]|nr:hypothetical protein [Nitrospira sp.]
MNIDRHRDSLAKYCYDLSKVTITLAVLNPIVTKPFSLVELLAGFLVGLLLLLLALSIEKGGTS